MTYNDGEKYTEEVHRIIKIFEKNKVPSKYGRECVKIKEGASVPLLFYIKLNGSSVNLLKSPIPSAKKSVLSSLI